MGRLDGDLAPATGCAHGIRPVDGQRFTAARVGIAVEARPGRAAPSSTIGAPATCLAVVPAASPILAAFLSDVAAGPRRPVPIPAAGVAEGVRTITAAPPRPSDDSSCATGAPLIVDGGIMSTHITTE